MTKLDRLERARDMEARDRTSRLVDRLVIILTDDEKRALSEHVASSDINDLAAWFTMPEDPSPDLRSALTKMGKDDLAGMLYDSLKALF